MTEREKFEKWFKENKEPQIDASQQFMVREIMWEGWKGKADSLDPKE